ncbi:MAG: hypothetical protein HOQ34_02585 [Gemmatimonadaceae bacterium]|nr:hypothetical protein [Gemmatimonadaceae bacterium]
MAALPVVLAGVGSHETAYRLDAGDTIVVGLSQRPLRAGDAAVTLVVSVDIADPDTGERLERLPDHLSIIGLATLGAPDGISLATLTASEHAEACARASAFLAGRRALAGLPVSG